MIQDIYPHKLVNAFIRGKGVEPDGLLFRFGSGGLACRLSGNRLALPRVADLPGGERRYLFSLDGTPCYLDVDAPQEAPEKEDNADVNSSAEGI